MHQKKRLLSLIGSGALLLGLFGASTGIVSADGTIDWTGNGVKNGLPEDIQCDDSNTPYLYWVFAGAGDGVTSATIHFGGTGSGDYAMIQDNGQWKLQNGPWFALDGLTASVSYMGTPDGGNPHLTISHGCPGETEESQPPSEAPSQVIETEAPSQVIETEVPSQSVAVETDAPSGSPFQSVNADTDAPSEPNTATIDGANGTGAPGEGAWLLVVALGMLLASIVVLTPARAKAPRR